MGGLAAATTATSTFPGSWWVFDVLAVFPLQRALFLALVAVALAWLRALRRAGVFLLPVALEIARLTPLYADVDHTPASDARLSLMTFNLYFQNDDVPAVLSLIEGSGAEVVVLEEVTDAWIADLARLAPPYALACKGARHAEVDVAIVARIPVHACETLSTPGQNSTLRAVIEWGGRPLTLFAVHTPPPMLPAWADRRDRQILALADWVRASAGPVVVAGDFNATPWSWAFRDLPALPVERRPRPAWIASRAPRPAPVPLGPPETSGGWFPP